MSKQAPPELHTLGDVERLNASSGKHFFDADTLRFFKSRIDYGYDLLYGRFFITTEKDGDLPRRASIRAAMDDGSIETVGEFQQFASPAVAVKALERERKQGVTVKHDPYEGDSDPFSFERFNWRVYVGGLPVGSRTTWRDAYEIAERLGYVDAFEYEAWRHGGWYVSNVRYPSGAVGCVSRQMVNPATEKPDRKWRIACDTREGDHTYRDRDEAARAERDLIAAGALPGEPVSINRNVNGNVVGHWSLNEPNEEAI